MTLIPRARQVLADVEIVRSKLEDEEGWVEWRLHWITALVLIRAVGHVLHKVDGDVEPIVRSVSNNRHKEWKGESDAHAIFRDFIEEERNSILKEYSTKMSEGPIPIVARLLNLETGEPTEIGALIEANVYRPMSGGPYEGEDGRTVLDWAIEWWHRELDLIEAEVGRRMGSR